ncbi:signal recognition particle-docking protein FtsY, partial [Desulfovibrio sp. 1214_IL3152]
REAAPRLSVWLGIVLEGVDETGDLLWQRLSFLLGALEAPPHEAQAFVDDFRDWTQRMDYRQVDEFRSELQYRLALALDLEDEEDERSRLFIKITEGLARTREQFARGLDALFSGHGELDDAFWEELEELFIMADLGYEPSLELVERLKERARKEKVTEASGMRALLMAEVEEIFRAPRRIAAVNPPEVVLMIGVNGVGKTTTIAKLAHRARMQGKKVMIAAADTFRAAAIEQLQVWAGRVGALFHAKSAGADPASVAYEAMDRAVREGVDILFVDTAGRLQTKVNLMEELTKIRQVLGKKHPGAPHRSILVIDATTGQNALSQTKLFKEAAGVDELILTKLDGTAKGGVAVAVAMQYHLPITFVGLGEKMEDLRPFNGEDYARALLGQKEE